MAQILLGLIYLFVVVKLFCKKWLHKLVWKLIANTNEPVAKFLASPLNTAIYQVPIFAETSTAASRYLLLRRATVTTPSGTVDTTNAAKLLLQSRYMLGDTLLFDDLRQFHAIVVGPVTDKSVLELRGAINDYPRPVNAEIKIAIHLFERPGTINISVNQWYPSITSYQIDRQEMFNIVDLGSLPEDIPSVENLLEDIQGLEEPEATEAKS